MSEMLRGQSLISCLALRVSGIGYEFLFFFCFAGFGSYGFLCAPMGSSGFMIVVFGVPTGSTMGSHGVRFQEPLAPRLFIVL